MATDLNIVALVGRLTRPCEMRYTNSGFAICSFSLAVNRRKKNPNGNWEDSVSFFDCTFFGKAAEGVSSYLTQGQQVSINGYLDQQSWETNGQKRSKVVVIVNSLSLLGSKNSNSNSNPYKQAYENNRNQNQNFNSNQNNTGNQQFGNTGNNYQNNPSNQNNSFNNANNAPINNGPEDFADDIPF
ncbi:MAG: single-stranded DNA-binding protein [Pleomorphochaeta sp.]